MFVFDQIRDLLGAFPEVIFQPRECNMVLFLSYRMQYGLYDEHLLLLS